MIGGSRASQLGAASGALKVAIGSFLTTDGASQSIDVGFKPTAVMLWSGGTLNNQGSSVSPTNLAVFQSFTDTAGESRCAATSVRATSDKNSFYSTDAVVLHYATAVRARASLTYTATGFTLDYYLQTTNTIWNNTVVNYIVWGGVETSLVEWVPSPANAALAVTGVGFQPDLVLSIGSGNTTAASVVNTVSTSTNVVHGSGLFGAMALSGQVSRAYGLQDATTSYVNYHVNHTAAGVAGMYNSSLTVRGQLVSFNANGFTVDTTTTASGYGRIFSLCFKNSKAIVGNVTVNSTGPITVNKRPKLVIWLESGAVALGSAQLAGTLSIGAFDARTGAQRIGYFVDPQGGATTAGIDTSNYVSAYALNDTTLDRTMDITLPTDTGFSVVPSTTLASPPTSSYIVF